MGRASTITALPDDARRMLERALIDRGFSGYEELEALMRDHGYVVSKSAIHRYGVRIEKKFAAIKASTEAARIITEGAADDQDARSEAVIALCQTEIFDAMVSLQEASDEELTPIERMNAMSKVAKNIATLTRASIAQKQFKETVIKRLKAMEADARTGKRALDAETLRIVREELYGV